MGRDNRTKARSGNRTAPTLPAVLLPETDAPAIAIGGKSFDLDDPHRPAWLDEAALASGGYPYAGAMNDDDYERELKGLQVELVKLQKWTGATGRRIVLLFEGRDAGGKGGAIHAITAYLNPRSARVVALPKPSETERGQWYFQRYVSELPTAGEMVLFDRSWYNRAGVEPVMGFCTPEQTSRFLEEAPSFERMMAREGLVLLKFWMEIGREMQLVQFHQRRHDPLKIWKLSPIDYAAMTRWDDYTKARNAMLAATHTPDCPWTIVLANDKRRARLSVIRHILSCLPYAGRDTTVVGATDGRVLFNDPAQLTASGRRRRARRP